ncbi:MAG: endonuclease III domain-containing protein [Candidatus Omnitrophota bacterium]
MKIYRRMHERFGPQGWWPGDSPFEVAIGAILTQNTSWDNVEKAIGNLKGARRLSFSRMHSLSQRQLSRLIRPAGYYNIKARRLKNFLDFLNKEYQGRLENMRSKDIVFLRRQLLSVNGIGPETADSVLLYALDKPIFVIDAYTRRIFSRHHLLKEDSDYQDIQDFFMRHLSPQGKLFNEYHALLVKCAKEFCRKSKAHCRECPLEEKK